MAKKQKPLFPETLIVFADEGVLLAEQELEHVRDGAVAIYVLAEIKTKRTTHKLE